MKKRVLFLGLILAGTLTAQAQVPDTIFQKREVIIIDEDPDEVLGRPIVYDAGTSKQTTNKTVKIELHKNGRRVETSLTAIPMIALGYNGLVESLGHMELPADAEWMDLEPKSVNFKLGLLQYRYMPVRHFGFQAGLELEVANFRFSENMIPVLNETGDYVVPGYLPYPLKKSKLVNCYLNLPVMLRVGIGYKNQVVLSGGVVGGWRWSSHTKEKSSANGKIDHHGDLNLRNFHYGYTAGATFFKNIGVYATYYPQSIFKAGQGPDVRQVNIGISLCY